MLNKVVFFGSLALQQRLTLTFGIKTPKSLLIKGIIGKFARIYLFVSMTVGRQTPEKVSCYEGLYRWPNAKAQSSLHETRLIFHLDRNI